MLYLVTTNHFDGPPPPSPEARDELFGVVAASVEALDKLQKQGKIVAGGVPAGQKKHVFIVEADSNDEVTELVHGLPFWILHQWKITPLESWSHHLGFVDKLRG